MSIQYYYNGKPVKFKKDIPKDAEHINTVKIHEEHYGNEVYIRKQAKAAIDFFKNLKNDREELEKRHG